jgi:hypothetical protein
MAQRESTALSKQVGLHTGGNAPPARGASWGWKVEMKMADVIERNAATQNLYREVNERVAEVNSQFGGGVRAGKSSELMELFCECGRQDPCGERVNVTAAAYERVRADATTFILLPGHGEIAVEDVIDQGEGYLIARNFGRAAEIARAADPRRLVDVGSG